MSERHVQHWILPDATTWAEVDALARAHGGELAEDAPRTFGDAARRVWSFAGSEGEPDMWLAVVDYHHFDVRHVSVEAVDAARCEALVSALPKLERELAWTWAASDEPRARMRGLRHLALQRLPWSERLAELLRTALAESEAALRWAAIRSISVGVWPEAAALLTTATRSTDEHELGVCERLAAVLLAPPPE